MLPAGCRSCVLGSSVKIVSRRAPGARILDDVEHLQRALNQLRGHALVQRGLYRFSSFEAADEWMTSQIAHTAARQSSRTSWTSAGRSARKGSDIS